MDISILQPVAALMLLTLAVWLFMGVRRLGYLIPNKIPPQKSASPASMDAVLPEAIQRPGNNFRNLFELPVIFYALCLALFAWQAADNLFVNLAWIYVALRAVHSAIHCTVNIVPYRFLAYLLSSIVLWVMVFRFTLMLF